MTKATRVIAIGAACLVLGGLAMGAAPRVTRTAARASIDPFDLQAPAGVKVASTAVGPTEMPGENDPPGRAVRKHRPPVRPVYRPPVRSPFRPTPRR
jgi:hypothetical protein